MGLPCFACSALFGWICLGVEEKYMDNPLPHQFNKPGISNFRSTTSFPNLSITISIPFLPNPQFTLPVKKVNVNELQATKENGMC